MEWLIDPEERTGFIYLPNRAPIACDQPDQLLPMPSFAAELELTVDELFAWLLE
jgi:Uma2 family endonuclease